MTISLAQVADVPESVVHFRTDFRLLFMLALVALLIYVATKVSARKLVAVIGIGLFMMLFMGLSYVRVQIPSPAPINEAAIQVSTRPQSDIASTDKGMSTEEMWDHLTRSQIPLDSLETGADEPSADESGQEVSADDQQAEEPPPHRPDWVDHPPKRIGNVYREVVSSDRYSTVEECHQELNEKIQAVIQRRFDQASDGNYRLKAQRLGFGLAFALREVCRQEWTETDEASFGEMKRVHVFMEFDQTVDAQFRQAYRDYERRFRITEVGTFAGLGLGSIALLFGLLKVDTWTKGYYTKRLFFGVPAVIIAIVALFIS